MTDAAGHFFGRRKGRPLKAGRLSVLSDNNLVIASLAPQQTVAPRLFFATDYRDYALEIGFGNGEHLVAQAARAPDIGFIGCEAFINGVSACLADAAIAQTNNIRLWPDDAMLLLPQIADGTLGMIYLLFSDPWPKTKHHKRRFLQAHTVQHLARLLRVGGVLRVATDDINLAQWSLLHAVQHPQLQWRTAHDASWEHAPADWLETRYQQKAAAQGRQPFFMDFIRV